MADGMSDTQQRKKKTNTHKKKTHTRTHFQEVSRNKAASFLRILTAVSQKKKKKKRYVERQRDNTAALLATQVRSSQRRETNGAKTVVLTRELQPGVSRGVAHARRRVSAVGHVRLGALGLAVDHGQAQTQAFGVGLSPGQRDETGLGCLM